MISFFFLLTKATRANVVPTDLFLNKFIFFLSRFGLLVCIRCFIEEEVVFE